MSGGLSVEQHIDAVDVFARTLFIRARDDFPSIANAVQQLHVALRHLRVEAADPDSPLSGGSYTHQVAPLIDDCGVALRQLEDALGDGRRGDQAAGRVRRLRERVDGFLDAVQLQTRATIPPATQDESSLEGIKDKVDNVAQRVFSRRDSGFSGDEDGLWREFRSELEKEGFSPEVLRKHKKVLRAYVRGLESMSSETGVAQPTVRGLLEYEAEASAPKEMYPGIDNEKFAPSMKTARRMPGEEPTRRRDGSGAPPIPPKEPLPELAANEPRGSFSSQENSPRSETSDLSLALISTQDLIAMDNRAATQLSAYQQSPQPYGASPSQRYLPSPHHAGMLTAGDLAELPGSPNSMVLGTSPVNAPLPTYSSLSSGPPGYGASPGMGTSTFRLAPDSSGRAIPMDAQWTKINRDRVSPEVLDRAGVRYEARPTYVAVLGRLTKGQIAEFARQTRDCRAARFLRSHTHRSAHHDRADSKSSYDEPTDHSDLFDESDETDSDDDKFFAKDRAPGASEKGKLSSERSRHSDKVRASEKGTRSYPYIVEPPEKEKGSPSSTVPPKSILKNKNEHHVSFDPQPHEMESKSPRDGKDDRHEKERRRRHRDHDDRSHDRYPSDREREQREPRDRDRHAQRRYHDDREHRRRRDDRREREDFTRDRRDRDDYRRERDDRREWRRERDEDGRRDDPRAERRSKKKAWGETLGAVGIGGAAVSLLSVLAEAASSV